MRCPFCRHMLGHSYQCPLWLPSMPKPNPVLSQVRIIIPSDFALCPMTQKRKSSQTRKPPELNRLASGRTQSNMRILSGASERNGNSLYCGWYETRNHPSGIRLSRQLRRSGKGISISYFRQWNARDHAGRIPRQWPQSARPASLTTHGTRAELCVHEVQNP